MRDSGTDNPGIHQRTLAASVPLVGIGLHNGKPAALRIRPAGAGFGIQFSVRGRRIPANWRNVVDTTLCTTLGDGNGTEVATVEHLLAALYASGIDNALIKVSGNEVPIMDGSAAPFMDAIAGVGTVSLHVPRKVLIVHRPVGLWQGDAYAFATPAMETRFTIDVDFDNPAVGSQMVSSSPDCPDFRAGIAAARTFGFSSDLEALRKQGKALGGSIRNAILVDGATVANPEGLRYPDEFARHKLLDFVGDVALAGCRVHGHFFGSRCGHRLNNALLHALLADESAYSIRTLGNETAPTKAVTALVPEASVRLS